MTDNHPEFDKISPFSISSFVNKSKIDQYPIDEILNKDDRVVRSWLSVEVKDRQGEILPINDMRKSLNTWMDRGGFITDQHSNRVVGKALRWFEKTHPKTNQDAIVLDYKIFKDYTIDDMVWEEIKNGKRKGLSFGGRATGKSTEGVDDYSGEDATKLTGLETYEAASVTEPANQFATTMAVNLLAKGMKTVPVDTDAKEYDEVKLLVQDFQKGYAVEDISKPFGGFNNFEACELAQTDRGHSDESAKRICGWLMHQTDKDFLSRKCPDKKPKTKTDDTDKALKGTNDNQTIGDESTMEGKTKSKKEEEGKKPKDEPSTEEKTKSTTDILLEKMIGKLDTIISSNKAQDEEDKKPPKDEDDEEDAKSKKKEDESTEDSSEDEKTDESATSDDAETDADDSSSDAESETEAPITEKTLEKIIDKKFKDTLKSMGLDNVTKATTPRTKQEDVTKTAPEKVDVAMDMLKKAKSGEMSQADMNRQTSNMVNKSRDEALKEVLKD